MCDQNPIGPGGKRIQGKLDLRGVEFQARFTNGEIDLSDVDLREAFLQKCRFERIRFCGSDLTHAEIGGTTFHLCDFDGAILRDTEGHAEFLQASLAGSVVAGLDLTAASGTWTPLESIDWHLALYNPETLRELKLPDFHNSTVSHRSFNEYNFADRNLRGFDFRRAQLKGTRFRGADLSKADFTEADLTDADLALAILTDAAVTIEQIKSARNWLRANVGSDELRKALKLPSDQVIRIASGNFNRCDFTDFDFRNQELTAMSFEGATLRHADLSELDLTGTRLHAADLTEANLTGATLDDKTGLVAWQLRGTDVTGAKLPDKIGEFSGLEQVAKIAPSAAKQFLGILAACLYCWLTIASTTDVALILGSATLPLPVVQTPIRIAGFYWFAPLVLVTAFLYFQVNLHRMWEALAKLPAFFPDGRRLDERVYPWMLIQKVRGRYSRLRGDYTLTPRLENRLGSALAYGAVPVTLLAFLYRALVRHDLWLTGLHVALWTLAVLIALLCHRSAVDALEGKPMIRGWRYALSASSVRAWASCLIAGVALWAYALHEISNRSADLEDAELSTKPDGWADGQADISRVKGAKLANARLEKADMVGAFLAKADLSHADLSGANLIRADLRGANLSAANLMLVRPHSANLEGAILDGAKFDKTDFSDAANWILARYSEDGLQKLGLPRDHDDKLAERDFRGYKIEGGQYFYHANLVGANFENGELQRAHMDSADLSNANLHHCNLSAAIFTGTKLTKADLRGADLSHASGLTEAQLREAILDADTKLPNAFHDLIR